jgi:hypothetical protein
MGRSGWMRAIAAGATTVRIKARTKALALQRAGLKPGASDEAEQLFVRILEVCVPVETVFVEAQEAS